MEIIQKYNALEDFFRQHHKVIIAFSGGVDSSFLAKVAFDSLGFDMIAITAKTSTLAENEFKDAKEIAQSIGCKHEFIEYEELDNKNFRNNPHNRCYYCKNMLFSKLQEYINQNNFDCIVEGSNHDDLVDHRPGMQAAKEFGIKSPLMDMGFTKMEIRQLSKQLGLKTYDKPEMACLSSRIPAGNIITIEKLKMIEQAESFIRQFGISQLRVRHFEKLAKIEVLEDDFQKIHNNFPAIENELRNIGFTQVIVDEHGYRRGSLSKVA